MRVHFFVVDETALPEASMRQAAELGPQAVVDAMLACAGPWGEANVSPDDYADVFRVLGAAVGAEDFLLDMAFAGSPYLVLAGHPGPWRLGYLEASLVQHLQPVLNALAESLAAQIARLPPDANTVYLRLRQALDDAFMRHGAVAIVHAS